MDNSEEIIRLKQIKKREDDINRFEYMLPFLKSNVPYNQLDTLIDGKTLEKRVKEVDCQGEVLGKFYLYESLLNDCLKSIEKFVKEGYSFLFFGYNESGKTFTALHLLCSAIEQGFSGYYIMFKDFMNLYNQTEYNFDAEDEEKKKHYTIKNSDLLVLDEIGKEAGSGKNVSSNARSTLEELIKYRSSNNMSTILVTNMRPDGFRKPDYYGESVWNSMIEKYRWIWFWKGGEFRKKTRKTWDL